MLYFTLKQIPHQLRWAKRRDEIEAQVCGRTLDTIETETGRAAALPDDPASLAWARGLGLELVPLALVQAS